MAAVARAIVCEAVPQRAAPSSQQQTRRDSASGGAGKIVLQPRLATLRSYGAGAGGSEAVTRKRLPGEVLEGGVGDAARGAPFFASLADYIESSRKSQDFETISGRLAMIAFATAVAVEATTGDSLFKKLDTVQIEEATGVCLAVVASAATFAWVSSARGRIGQMLTLGCNSFVDTLIDNVVDALFADGQLQDWSDDA